MFVLLLTGRWFFRVDEIIREAKIVNQNLKGTSTKVSHIINQLRDYNGKQVER